MKKKQKLGKLQEKWVKALESGKYKQDTENGYLKYNGKYCCLGVACELEGSLKSKPEEFGQYYIKNTKNSFGLSKRLVKKYGFYGQLGETSDRDLSEGYICLADMNDSGRTFKQIAKFIRNNPEKIFKKSV